MRERMALGQAGRRTTTKLRLKASHRRAVAPLRISHHHGGGAWEPPMKDVDRLEDAPTPRKGK
jgi:hypothetical protein